MIGPTAAQLALPVLSAPPQRRARWLVRCAVRRADRR